MLTVHFADESHLLVTHAVRELIARRAGDPVDDDDRIVEGELVELPSGKVLAKTRWHMHDHGRYLWSLGHGRFLIREGEALSTFAPLANLQTPDPFFRVPLEYRHGILDGIVVSADNQLLTIETHAPETKKLGKLGLTIRTHNGELVKPLLYLDFYRISGHGTEASPFVATHAGVTRSEQAVRLPVDADGYLAAQEPKHSRWAVDFQGFGTKSTPIGTVDSSCPPGLELVSPTQWLAFSCRNPMSDNITLVAYDFAKHEIWQESMGSLPSAPAFALAPEASRFAISRRLEFSASKSPLSPDINTGTTQEVRVYATQSGDLLAKVNCAPAFLTAENFDLAPDGMRLAYVKDGTIEIFRLPELTKIDREDLAELHKLLPAPGQGLVNLQRLAVGEDLTEPTGAVAASVKEPEAGPSSTNSDGEPVSLASAASGPTAALAPSANPVVDAPESETVASMAPEETRKPPTLLKPGERPELKVKGPKPESKN